MCVVIIHIFFTYFFLYILDAYILAYFIKENNDILFNVILKVLKMFKHCFKLDSYSISHLILSNIGF